MSPAAKKIRRKDLRQPDEFFTMTGEALDWAERNRNTIVIAVVAVVAMFLVGWGVRWYVDARETRAAREFYAASELFKREQWDAARDGFKAIGENLPRTDYGRLAALYAGYASLRGDHAAEAAASFRAFLDGNPPTEALKQLGHLNLARALQASGDLDAARQELQAAADIDGPAKSDATFELARAVETAGDQAKALELYQKFLTDYPESSERDLARAHMIALGGTPPAEPTPASGANALQFQMNGLGSE
jgi:predicted negative regulator of RcsB-dependent stress response